MTVSAMLRKRGSVPAPSNRAALAAAALLGSLLACSDSGPVQAQGEVHSSERHGYRIVAVAQGLAHPWGMAFLPGGDILVTERPGRLRRIRDGALEPEPIAGVPDVWAQGQGGLLDIALHPGFATNRLVYLSYSRSGPQGATTAVIRGRLDGDRLVDVEDVIEARAWGGAGQHFGSRLLFDRDGYLFITVGDRGDRPDRGADHRSQDPGDHAGTTLRLHDDGRVPGDNPFVGRQDALAEIYSYGHRNAQGMDLNPETGEVWLNEHGPRGGDEINLVRAGRNYGWPLVTHGINYDGSPITDRTEGPGLEPPLLDWTPSIAPSGMTFYTGDAFPEWRGNAFVGALAGQHLRRVVLDGTAVVAEEELLRGQGYRIRDVRTGPDGYIYLLVDAPAAPVLRLEPTDAG